MLIIVKILQLFYRNVDILEMKSMIIFDLKLFNLHSLAVLVRVKMSLTVL